VAHSDEDAQLYVDNFAGFAEVITRS